MPLGIVSILSLSISVITYFCMGNQQQHTTAILRLESADDYLEQAAKEWNQQVSFHNKSERKEMFPLSGHGYFLVDKAKEALADLALENSPQAASYAQWQKRLYEVSTVFLSRQAPEEGFNQQLVNARRVNHSLLEYLYSEESKLKTLYSWSLGLFLLGALGALAGVLLFVHRKMVQPLDKLKLQAEQLNQSREVSFEIKESNPLLYPIVNSLQAYDKKIRGVVKISDAFGEGDFGQDLSFLKKAGSLGSSILRMTERIRENREEEKKRMWGSQSLEDFTRILREQNQGVDQLLQKVTSALVSSVGANQGGLFLQEGEEKSLVLKAAYAWGKRKYHQMTYSHGEGLIGQAVLDQETIYITDVPEDFINITSGLGKANPSCILLVPLKFNDTILGVIELASLDELDTHQIVLVEKLAESLASALSTIHTTRHTASLLEESRNITRQLQHKEEELRNNSQELESAKENLSRQLKEATREMELRIKEIEGERKKNIAILEGCVDGVITFDQKGKIEFLNQAAEEIWNIERSQIIGRSIKEYIPIEFIREGERFKAYYVWEGNMKPIDERTELQIKDQYGEEMSVLLTLSDACVGDSAHFAIFIQRISVELF